MAAFVNKHSSEKGIDVVICAAPLLIMISALAYYGDRNRRSPKGHSPKEHSSKEHGPMFPWLKAFAKSPRASNGGASSGDKSASPSADDVTDARTPTSEPSGATDTWQQKTSGAMGHVSRAVSEWGSGEAPGSAAWEGEILTDDIWHYWWTPRGTRGGVGNIYDAIVKGERVALKVASTRAELSKPELRSRIEDFKLLITEERYKRCGSLVRYRGWADVGVSAPKVGLMMEWLPETLQTLLDPWSPSRLAARPAAAQWLLAIAEGLKALHDLSWAHGDVRPEKILASKDGTTVKLGDFGLRYIGARKPDRIGSIAENPLAGGSPKPQKAGVACEIECEEDEPDYAADVVGFGRVMAYLERYDCPGTKTKEYRNLRDICLRVAGGDARSMEGVIQLLQSLPSDRQPLRQLESFKEKREVQPGTLTEAT